MLQLRVDVEEKGGTNFGIITLKSRQNLAFPHWCVLPKTERLLVRQNPTTRDRSYGTSFSSWPGSTDKLFVWIDERNPWPRCRQTRVLATALTSQPWHSWCWWLNGGRTCPARDSCEMTRERDEIAVTWQEDIPFNCLMSFRPASIS